MISAGDDTQLSAEPRSVKLSCFASVTLENVVTNSKCEVNAFVKIREYPH